MHNRLGRAGRSRRIHDVERVVEIGWLELRLRGRVVEQVGVFDDRGVRQLACGSRKRDADDLLDTRNLLEHAVHLRVEREALPVVVVAVGDDEQLRPHLPEAVHDSLRAKVRRAGSPDAARRGRCQHQHQRLDTVRDERRHACSLAQPERAQAGLRARHPQAQLAACQTHVVAPFGAADDCGEFVVAHQQILGVVEARAGEPACARHRRLGQYRVVAAAGAQPRELPEVGPERFHLVERPAVDVSVGFELRRRRLHKVPEQACLAALLRRLPQHGIHGVAVPATEKATSSRLSG